LENILGLFDVAIGVNVDELFDEFEGFLNKSKE
jgi:hypothetical protein